MSILVKEKKKSLLCFGDFMLDVERRGLFNGQERMHLTPKPLEALIFLVENRGHVVEKQELLEAVWKGTFVTDDTLVHAIREIRRALGDDKDNPRFIQTVPRQGYRFVGAVSFEFPFVKNESSDAVPLTVVSQSKSLRWLWVALTILAIVSVSAILILLVRNKMTTQQSSSKTPNTQRKGELTPQSPKSLTWGKFNSGKPAFSPNGEFIVYVSSSEETKGYGDIFVMPTTEGEPLQVTKKANPSGDLPVFTADSSHIVFSRFRDGEDGSRLPDLWIVPTFSGQLRRYIPNALGAGFSPDGKQVAYTKYLSSYKALWVSPTANLGEHREISANAFTPRWSPDGKWIAYTNSYPEGGDGDIWIIDATTLSEPKNLTQEAQQIYGLTWTADSQSIIFTSKRTGPSLLWKIGINGEVIEPVISGVGDYVVPSVSPNGKTLIFSQGHPSVDLFMSDGIRNSDDKGLTQGDYHLWLKLSPSGEHIATIMQRPDFEEHLSILDIKTGKSIKSEDHPIIHPYWLDDENVAYIVGDKNTKMSNIRVLNIVTGAVDTRTQFQGKTRWVAFHPNQKKIAVVQISSDGKQSIVLRDLETQADQTLVEGGIYECLRWSPDGKILSWSGENKSSDQANNGVWMIEIGQTQPRHLVKDGYCPVWSADGSKIYYSRTRGFAGLWQFDMKQQIKIRSWGNVSSFDLAGERLVFAQGGGEFHIYSLELSQ
jgi:Tol biopolymer transport system component/DNA-binding winged helix-turn-helix (wHTH) protein